MTLRFRSAGKGLGDGHRRECLRLRGESSPGKRNSENSEAVKVGHPQWLQNFTYIKMPSGGYYSLNDWATLPEILIQLIPW